MLFILLIWIYTIPWALMPLMGVWNRFVPEGFLTSCTFDYLTDTDDTRSFVATIFTFSYCLPMSLIIYYYSHIVGFVVNHEKALKKQAKKMNVESLRSNVDKNAQSAEVRIAKVFLYINIQIHVINHKSRHQSCLLWWPLSINKFRKVLIIQSCLFNQVKFASIQSKIDHDYFQHVYLYMTRRTNGSNKQFWFFYHLTLTQ